jgi:UDP-N-acetylmuramate--alanine ligase
MNCRIPVVRRAEMLAELMRLKSTVAVAGTHGKTTTTSMVAALLDAGGVDPTVINGGIINSYGSNARLGASDWMVVEADESDGSFLRLDGTIAVVTNIDPEHLDHYGSFDAVKSAFVEFVENVPFYGAALLCLDHPEVQAIMPRIRDRADRDLWLLHPGRCARRECHADPGRQPLRRRHPRPRRITPPIEGIELPMPGRHNVQNALAAIGVALEMGIADATIQQGFARFGGVKRRFTKVGEIAAGRRRDRDRRLRPSSRRDPRGAGRRARGRTGQGDRGGPAASLFAPRQSDGRVPAGVQRRRHRAMSRRSMRRAKRRSRVSIPPPWSRACAARAPRGGEIADAAALAEVLAADLQPGDMVVCLGAGDITKWAAGLADAVTAAKDDMSALATIPRVRGKLTQAPACAASSGSRRAVRPNGCSNPRTPTI